VRICLIGSSRFPMREPFAGGLEALTYHLAAGLIARGHEVAIFAAPGSECGFHVDELPVAPFTPSEASRADVGASPDEWMSEHHAYLALMLDLARTGHRRFDVVHNHSLHHLPIAMAGTLAVPMLTTLHTPPISWLESAIRLEGHQSSFAAVSAFTARSWQHVADAKAVLNGVDTTTWRPGPGGTNAIWFGRLVPEKAPHIAIDAARAAGLELVLCGPVYDAGYYRSEVEPRLGDDVRHVGHLAHPQLVELVGRAAVAIVSPAWDEPYGLVAAEAMSCGTPVVATARGALPEVVSALSGRLSESDRAADLATAMSEALTLDRDVVRRDAVDRLSLARMIDEYEVEYERLVSGRLLVA
jgi:glycosyltransferase involved in cell wall biosynthesis